MAAFTMQEHRPPQDNSDINFSSNNPFRRAASPAMPSPNALAPAFPNQNPRRISTNPFLDDFATENAPPPVKAPRSPPKAPQSSSNRPYRGVPPNAQMGNVMTDVGNMQHKALPIRAGTLPVSSSQRPVRSQERDARARVEPRDDFLRPRPNDQVRSSENRRPRRNSESSIMETKDEERLRRERRRERERERGDKPRDPKDPKSRSSKPKKPNQKLDIIDKLDVTSIYGTGLFHHDGPFDACNPHRNRKGAKAAPMQAFPEGSSNNAIGGSGPVRKNLDLDTFHGRGVEGYNDFNDTQTQNAQIWPSADGNSKSYRPLETFNAKTAEAVHGEETFGLGTSTFLEGAPASRAALQARDGENEISTGASGIQRKKSMAQRLRGFSRSRPGGADGRVHSPDSNNNFDRLSPTSPGPSGTQSAGGRTGIYDYNPFFADTSEKQNARTKAGAVVGESESRENSLDFQSNRPLPSTSPRRGLVKIASPEDTSTENKPSGGGLLSRVKSLKSGRRTRERAGSAA